jgi:hypothetical protein
MLLALLQVTNTSVVWYKDPLTVATIVIAVATVAYFISTMLLWRETRDSVRITRDMFEASHRPYIGLTAISHTISDEKATFTVRYKNAGSVPARDFKVGVQVVANGIVVPQGAREEEDISVIPPGLEQFDIATITGPNELKAVKDAHTLAILFKCSYKGMTDKEYCYTDKLVHYGAGTWSSTKAVYS